MQQPITDPSVPYVGPIEGGFGPGSMIRIQGQVPPTADRFDINLHCGPPPSDTALHLSVRLLQNYIARNSIEDGTWGNEEDSGSLPIAPGQNFEILVLCDPSSYKIAINGEHFAEFRHRIPFRQISHLAINGDVTVRLIAFESGGGSAPAAPPPRMSAPDYAYGPPNQYGPPPPNQYGPPPGQYGPPQGPYGQGPYGGGPPLPPGHKEESGLDSFLESAGTVIAGAFASGAAQNLLSGFTGSGGQAQHPQQQYYQPPPPPPQPQQPLFQLGGQGSVGGLGSVGSLLQTFAGQMLAGPKKMPMPTSVPVPPAGMPMPSAKSLPSPHMPPPYRAPPPSYPTQPLPPPSYPTQPIPPYSYSTRILPPPSYPTRPLSPPCYPSQPLSPPPYSMRPLPPPSYPTQPLPPPLYPSQPLPPFSYARQQMGSSYSYAQGYAPPMYPPQKVKKSKMKKALKYGLPIAGAGLGAIALSHALHHSSSSSSDSD